MKIKHLNLLLISQLLCISSCKKQETTKLSEPVTGSNPLVVTKVKQKIITSDPKTIKNCIETLKNYSNLSRQSLKTSSQDIAIDSALWLLEATLNYDFNQIASNFTSHDSTGVLIQLTDTNSITLDDLSFAYNTLYNYVYQNAQQNKHVKVIDIYAYKNNTQLNISANIIFSENTSGNKTENVCDPYSGIKARWSLPLTNTPPFFYCTNYTTNNDGPTLCNNKLNCYQYNPPCYPYYYTNVITITFDNINNTYPNALFYDFYYTGSPQNVCNPPELYDFQLNNYITGCRNLGQSNIPTSPSGYIITNYNVSASFFIQPPPPASGGGYTKLFWKLDVTYGIPTCYPND